MKVATSADMDCATGRAWPCKVQDKKASVMEASVEEVHLMLCTDNAEVGWSIFECKSQTLGRSEEL